MGQSGHGPRGLSADVAPVMPPVCALKCHMKFAPATSSSGPIRSLCSQQVVPAVSDDLNACLASSCTLQELLQAKRFTVELCQEPQTDLGPTILAVVWASEAISVIAMVLRALARTAVLEANRFEANRWGWDDTVITVALLANLGSGITIAIVYLFSLGQVKVAILLFYLRIFPRQSGHYRFRILCWIMLTAISIYTVAHILLLIFQCWPVSYAWTRYEGQGQGTCWEFGASVLTHGVLNMISDWVIFFMPIKNLIELKMSRAKKVLVIVVFAWGLGGSVCSVFRLVELARVARSYAAQGPNYTQTLAPFLMWSTAKVNSTLFCACMPMAVQVVRRLLTRCQGLERESGSFGAHRRTDDMTDSERTAATKASRQSHFSLELTNVSEVALNEMRPHPPATEMKILAVNSCDYGSDVGLGGEDKAMCSISGSWDSVPGTAV
ncbi:uncharacterized protein PG998_006053 [Apiospora kogelbergensis]|uniref:uncharacterized protein n=1 Tax=Apiospora kogelbergensis TaxID=1337665 RepID=UPI00312E8694